MVKHTNLIYDCISCRTASQIYEGLMETKNGSYPWGRSHFFYFQM